MTTEEEWDGEERQGEVHFLAHSLKCPQQPTLGQAQPGGKTPSGSLCGWRGTMIHDLARSFSDKLDAKQSSQSSIKSPLRDVGATTPSLTFERHPPAPPGGYLTGPDSLPLLGRSLRTAQDSALWDCPSPQHTEDTPSRSGAKFEPIQWLPKNHRTTSQWEAAFLVKRGRSVSVMSPGQ